MEEAERLAAAAVDDDDEPGEVGGDNSKKINNKNKKKKKSIAQRKANAKKPQTGSGDLTSKVFATMEKHKEVFFTIRLHSAQSAASLGPIHDPDPLMQVQGEKVRFQTQTFHLSHQQTFESYAKIAESSFEQILRKFHFAVRFDGRKRRIPDDGSGSPLRVLKP